MPKVYIASPFFDDASKAWVTAKEEEFSGIKFQFFSPRQDGLNFNAVKGKLRSDRIKLIFFNNVRQLDECDHLCINLQPCNGKIDIGTLWEFGYFIGKHGMPDFSDPCNQLYAQPELYNAFVDYAVTLADHNSPFFSDPKVPYFILPNVPNKLMEFFMKGTNKGEEVEWSLVNEYQFNVKSSELYVCTDDFNWKTIMLLGWFYAHRIPYITVSFQNYGSNVMIAASSVAHISFSGMVDDTFRTNLE